MPVLSRTLMSIRRLIAVTGLSCVLCYFAAAQTNQNVYLPNPTPRDPDLHDKYKDDPASRARQQYAVQLRQAQIRQQVAGAADRLAQLAQQLKDEMEKNPKETPLSISAEKAAEIEKLAKSVKTSMKSQ
jgi:hypothetical protein